MMALPYITEGTGFKGKVYATEPTLQIGRYIGINCKSLLCIERVF